jgi:hypothetical protein
MQPQHRRRSPVAGLVIAGGIAVVAAAAVVVLVVVTNTAPASGPIWIAQPLFPVLGVSSAVFGGSCIAVWWSLVMIRERKVQNLHPNSFVFSTRMSEQLKNLTDRRSLHLVNGRMTYGFTVALDDDGLTVWGGSLLSPAAVIHIARSKIVSISAGAVKDAGQKPGGVLVTVSPDGERPSLK